MFAGRFVELPAVTPPPIVASRRLESMESEVMLERSMTMLRSRRERPAQSRPPLWIDSGSPGITRSAKRLTNLHGRGTPCYQRRFEIYRAIPQPGCLVRHGPSLFGYVDPASINLSRSAILRTSTSSGVMLIPCSKLITSPVPSFLTHQTKHFFPRFIPLSGGTPRRTRPSPIVEWQS
jgi:hypothetical protein